MDSVSKRDDLYFGYETAPRRNIPSKQIFVIEYPGYIKNMNKVLHTLGGEKGLKKAVNEDLMELRFRPDDPFCHPINGDVIPTSNLLLKVTRRKKKRQNKNGNRENEEKSNAKEDVKFDILGIINKTCRFRGMSDYQYVPNMNHPILEYRKALESLDVNKIMDFESIINNMNEETNLPPPSFSRVECPMDYGYQQNTAVVKVLVNKDDGQFLNIPSLVPEEPPPESSKNIEQMPQESIDRMNKLFEDRPIWTRLALENNLPSNDKRNIKRLLPLVAYLMSNGPWRDCWIRYGYDPRLNQEARFYQLLDIRNTRRPTKLGRAKRLLHIQEEAAEKDNTENSNIDSQTSHIFDGISTCRDIAVFQMHDITDPLLKKLIDSPDSLQEFCDERDGFYKHSELVKMRKVMRRKFKALTEGKILSDEDFDDLLNAHDEESENEDGGDEDEEISDTDSESKEGQIISKVDELMRNLQAAQRSQEDFEQDDEGTFYLDNSDMFEENESEVEAEEYEDFELI
ncbi:RNA polymerase III transcription factor IIIC subunit-domain-containing protein [Glomus cerebriforme]|uniref:RNA polymerase III transcription factor IIIC subunit-domain-containing protein n=1 Tax=Glomus cerebriforme TaxID=658196 RepID=A0A397SYC3_9GLOM|nr:RNA polymerase III transcription factor IIIC subunit-domain-containing protein [Glomus cerebriforme]